jgi:hypothetical protein
MSNTTSCQHCGQGLLSRDVACYADGLAVCRRCFDAHGYAYVVSEGGYVREAGWSRGDRAAADAYYR